MLVDAYKVISFDMFQTLVDVNTCKYDILRRLFKDDFLKDRADLFWEDANKKVYSYFHAMAEKHKPFATVLSVFEACYKELFPGYGIHMDPLEGAVILAKAHGNAALYPEVPHVYPVIKSAFRTCLISDADHIMIDPLLKQMEFDRVYVSESCTSYKNDQSGRIFRTAMDDFGILPHEMLHIGDGTNDVVGAKMAGAAAVWVNRDNRIWNHRVQPDHTIHSLSELIQPL